MLSLQSAMKTRCDHILTSMIFASPAFKCYERKIIDSKKEITTKRHMQTWDMRQTESQTHTHAHAHTDIQYWASTKVLIRGAVARSGQVCCIFRQIREDHGIKE